VTATATERPPASAPPFAGPQLYAGTGSLLRFALRRDRRRLLIWVLALGGLAVYTAVGLATIYPTAADRQGRAALMGAPVGVLLSGPGYGLDHYTLGAMVANELALSVMVAAAIMSIQLVVRHTRAEEESGRAELVRAAIVGRRAPLTAALLETALADAAVALVIAAGLAGAGGLSAVDSLALAAAIGLTGLLFGAVAAVTAQISEHSRAASGYAMAVLAAAVVVRGVGDILQTHGSALSWFSPIAWAQQTRAFVDVRWWPLLLSVEAVAVLVVLGYRLVAIRDVGSGLRAQRPGRPAAGAALSGVAGLTARLQRGSMLGWAVALVLAGAVFGSLADQVAGMVAGNAQLARIIGASGNHDLTDGFFAAISQELGLAVAAFAVASVLRLHAEEAAGRTEVVLATAVDRRRYLGAGLAVATAACTGLLLLAGLVTGVVAAATSGDAGRVGSQLGAQLAQLPAVLLCAGIAAALLGLAPRAAGLAWLVVTWSVVSVFFGALLGLPHWALRLSPFGWLSRVPDEPADWAALIGLTVVAAVLVGLGLVGFRRRDVPA
jgi:ABC-2 type transport system permease protein